MTTNSDIVDMDTQCKSLRFNFHYHIASRADRLASYGCSDPFNDVLADDLIDACTEGNLSKLKTLFPLYQAVPPHSVPTPQFLLQTASQYGQAEVVRVIWSLLPEDNRTRQYPWDPTMPIGVSWKAIPKKWFIYENGVIHEALRAVEPLDVFKVFFEYGMRPDHSLDWAGNTTLCAIEMNKVDLARFLLQKGGKPTGYCRFREDTYLGAAARRPAPDMLNLLIESGSKLEGSQALRQAAERGQLQNAKILLGIGADVNEVFYKNDYPDLDRKVVSGCPLHFAVRGCSAAVSSNRQVTKLDMVMFLLSRGAETHVVDGHGKTPLNIAVQQNDQDIVDLL